MAVKKKPIQMQLSQKQKFISHLVSAFLRSRLTFKHFQKNDDPHGSFICEIADSGKRG